MPARHVYRANAGSSPRPEAATGRFDLASAGEPAAGLDATWAGISPAAIELSWPDTRVRAVLEISADVDPLVALASPEEIDAIAVEPQTHGPDPFRRLIGREPDAPALLPPGGELRLDLRLTVGRVRLDG
jgi:galactose mutarotase-like enzyme